MKKMHIFGVHDIGFRIMLVIFWKVEVLGRNLRERLWVGRHKKRGRDGAKRKEEMRGRGYERLLGLRGFLGVRMSSLFGERCQICRMENGVRGHQAMCRPRITPTSCPGCRSVLEHNVYQQLEPWSVLSFFTNTDLSRRLFSPRSWERHCLMMPSCAGKLKY